VPAPANLATIAAIAQFNPYDITPRQLREAYDHGATITELMEASTLTYVEIRVKLQDAKTSFRTDEPRRVTATGAGPRARR